MSFTFLNELPSPAQIKERYQTEEDPTFSIYADQSVPVKEVVAVMNIAKRNHYKVILATQPE